MWRRVGCCDTARTDIVNKLRSWRTGQGGRDSADLIRWILRCFCDEVMTAFTRWTHKRTNVSPETHICSAKTGKRQNIQLNNRPHGSISVFAVSCIDQMNNDLKTGFYGAHRARWKSAGSPFKWGNAYGKCIPRVDNSLSKRMSIAYLIWVSFCAVYMCMFRRINPNKAEQNRALRAVLTVLSFIPRCSDESQRNAATLAVPLALGSLHRLKIILVQNCWIFSILGMSPLRLYAEPE